MRKLVRIAAAVGSCALVAVASGADAGSPRNRATGGGQILVGTRGAGDTIAFTAQNREDGSDAATGQLQYIQRTGGTGQGQVKNHATVTCLVVSGNTAKLGGYFVRGENEGSGFTMVVEDNGEGAAAAGDMIAIQQVDDPTCERQDGDDDGNTELARGNVQVHDAP